MKPVDLLIFDLDGTLVNTLEDIAASVNHTLAHFGRGHLPLDKVACYVGDGLTRLLERALNGSVELVPEASRIYNEHHRRHLVVRTTLYPSVADTLEHFQSLPMGVITNKTREFSEPLLERLGIRKYFGLIIGADNGLPLKPAPDSVLKIMRESGAQKERTVIVGDGTTDIRAGKAAGIITCAVTYGFRAEGELRQAGPDFIINAFSDLKKLFMSGK